MSDKPKYGVPTDEQLAKINKLTKRPFTKDEVFTYPVKQVGDALIPNRYVKLDKSLLEMYAKNGQNGDVAYMLNHRWTAWLGLSDQKGVINLGRVYDAYVAEAHDFDGENYGLYGAVYIPRDRTKDGVDTNEVIESVEDGSLRDVSVGIGWSRSECSICANDIRSKDCEHQIGRVYDGKLCYVIAKPPGDQFELSGVFAGAYPTAEALSAKPTDSTGNSEGSVEVLEAEDIKNVPLGAQMFAAFGDNNVTLFVRKGALKAGASLSIGSDKPAKGGEKVEDEKEKSVWDKFGESAEALNITVEQATAVLNKANEVANKHSVTLTELVSKLEGAVFGEVLVVGDGVALDRKAVVDALGKEMDADAILRLAKDGQSLKADLLNATLEWGVRAEGNAFARDTVAELLATASVEQLKKFGESYQTKAKESLSPGRKTEPAAKGDKPKGRAVPDSAFKA